MTTSHITRRRAVTAAAWSTPAVALAGSTPALAASVQNNYGLAASAYSYLDTTTDASGNRVIDRLYIDNFTAVDPGYPAGFAAINLPQDGSGAMSPSTTASFAEGPVYRFAYPVDWFFSQPSTSDFTVSGDYSVDSVTRQTVNGVDSFVVQLTWQGVMTGQTVDDQDAGQIPSWPGSEFSVETNPDVLNYYYGQYTDFQWTVAGTYTTANGETVIRDFPWQYEAIVLA